MGVFDPKGAVLVEVAEGGVAEAAGLKAGDRILTVNGQAPTDLMDLLDRAYAGPSTLEVARQDRHLLLELPQLEHEPLGAEFSDTFFNRVKTCRNKCVFCFMDQMPKKMRASLYYRDDDYRLSNLHGNFITLTNLAPAEWERIREQHISPLYISVHATDEELREHLLGDTKQAKQDIMACLRQLVDWGIELHTQIVLMPGLNDGAQLDKSIRDLASLAPHLQTISVVPVGLTKYRAHLPQLQPVTKDLVPAIVAQVEGYQAEFSQRFGDPMVYLADEMYLIGGLPMPPHRHYGDYPQHENGVGMVRKFLVDFNRRKRFFPKQSQQHVVMVTGEYGGQIFPPLIAELQQRVQGLQVDLLVVKNDFLGDLVRCAGLLSGRDVLAALQQQHLTPNSRVLMPGVALKDAAVIGEGARGMLLDDISLQNLADRFLVPFVNAGSTCEDWLTALFGQADEVYWPHPENPSELVIHQYPEHQKAS
jgi:putative radical SAM enzyme (TIGR03279 family)